MDRNEREIIDDLFARLRQAEEKGAREAEAEALIMRHVASQPAAPYYMAQAIVVQQDALGKAQARLQELERQLAGQQPSGGFLSGLFGGGQEAPATPARAGQPARGAYPQAGTGFLGGAMQTALGVAGGFLIADALTGLLSTDDAAAADAGPWDQAVPEDDEPLLGDDASMGDDGDIDMGGFDDF